MDLGVRDRVFVIVGGTSGMGFATARELAKEQARLALVARDQEKGEVCAGHLQDETGADVRMFVADAAQGGQMEPVMEQIAADMGAINGLAVTAGNTLNHEAFHDLTDTHWEAHFQTVLMSVVRSCRAALPHIITAGGGTIVNVAAYSIRSQKTALSAYSAMKSAVASVTKNIAVNYGAQGVRANTVCPGFIYTDRMNEIAAALSAELGISPEEALSRRMSEEWGMKVALGRVGRAEELGELIAFLLSGRAGYTSGALINSDGGTQF